MRQRSGLGSGFRRIAANLLVALFAVRAVLPLGFMPDLDAASAGRFEITLCSAYGPKTLVVDDPARPADDSPADRSRSTDGRDCPFFKAVAKPITLQVWSPFDRPAADGVPAPTTGPAQSPPYAFRSSLPVGSRAPPL